MRDFPHLNIQYFVPFSSRCGLRQQVFICVNGCGLLSSFPFVGGWVSKRVGGEEG